MQAIRLDRYKEPLLELRKHYQELLSNSGRKSAIAQEQLTHVNALVVDQLLENQGFVESLMEMRCHYQRIVQECDRVIAHAKEQITHVNALLVDQLVMQHNQPISMSASPVCENEDLSLTGAAFIGFESSAVPEDNLDQVDEPLEVEEASVPDSVEEVATRQDLDDQFSDLRTKESPLLESNPVLVSIPDEIKEPNKALGAFLTEEVDSRQEIYEPSSLEQSNGAEQLEEPANLNFSVNGHLAKSQFPPLKTPMLPQYQHLSKLQAVESLMRENVSTILHIDYIIRTLYGELEPDAIKEEKPRIYDTLSKGAQKGLWQKVPESVNCYTLDLNLVDPELAAKANQQQVGRRQKHQFRGKTATKMLPAYEQLNFTDAVSAVVRENAGQILSTDRVARALYGELEGQALTKAKEKVGKTLWSGANQKHWQRVPGQTGFYTLDMKLVAAP